MRVVGQSQIRVIRADPTQENYELLNCQTKEKRHKHRPSLCGKPENLNRV